MGTKLAADPVDRYLRLTAGAQPPTELSPQALEHVIAQKEVGADGEIAALAAHIAQHSRLRMTEAEATVKSAVDGVNEPAAKATAVSAALTATPAGEVQLSDPVMLAPFARLLFASLLACAIGGCIWQIAVLGEASHPQDSAIICLAVIAVLAMIGMLVLAMGYKNVTIKGGTAS